jgi:septal ring factor EnvC (AmiA/AmiB activator)
MLCNSFYHCFISPDDEVEQARRMAVNLTVKNLETNVEERKAEVKQLKTDLKKAETALTTKGQVVDHLECHIKEKDDNIQKLNLKVKELEAVIRVTNVEMNAMNGEKKKLKEALEMPKQKSESSRYCKFFICV